MNVSPQQKSTRLRTKDVTFEVIDWRGRGGFPKGQKGLLFEHREARTISDKYTGLNIHRAARYIVRTAAGEEGWRVDEVHHLFPTETVYGPKRETHWATNHEAAAALQGHLDEIRDNSSVGN